MTWEPRPVPTVTAETAAFWEAASEGRFLLATCGSCGLTFYYPRSHCPDCLSDDISWTEAAGKGEVYSYTVSEGVTDWPDDDRPHVIAYVELEEGPRVLTVLVNCEVEEVEIGTPVEARFVPTERDDVAIPVFQPLA